MKITVFDQKGGKKKEISLKEEIFGIDLKPSLVSETIQSYLSNLRQGTKKTKTKGEVRGGGRKPWRQKGTGRARAGSIRSPLWRGGGTIFGPTGEENYAKKINKKKRVLTLKSVLSMKANESNILTIEDFKLNKPKTKEVVKILEALPLKGRILFILPEKDESLIKTTRNLPYIKTVLFSSLNSLDVLNADKILFTVKALENLEKFLTKK